MPTKHINDNTWRLVEKETVKPVIELKVPVKDTEVLDWLIRKGLETMTEDDLFCTTVKKLPASARVF